MDAPTCRAFQKKSETDLESAGVPSACAHEQKREILRNLRFLGFVDWSCPQAPGLAFPMVIYSLMLIWGGMHQQGGHNLQVTIIILGLLLASAAELILHAGAGIVSGYTHLYYLVIIFAAYYFRYTGAIVALYLAFIHISAEILLTGTPSPDALLRSGSFLATAVLSAFLFTALPARTPVSETLQEGMYRVRAMMVREEDIMEMRKQGDVTSLLSVLAHGEMDQRYAAIDALGLLRDPKAIELLVESLRSDAYSGLRWKAAEALARIGKPAVGPLITMLTDPDEDVRWKVAIALGEIGDTRAVEPLLSLFADPDAYVRSRAAFALARFGDRIVPDLIRQVSSDDPHVRFSAVSALGEIGSEESVPGLAAALFDPVDRVKAEAAAALHQIGSPAIPALAEILDSASPERLQRLFADPGVAERLAVLFDAADEPTRQRIAPLLDRIGECSISSPPGELNDEDV